MAFLNVPTFLGYLAFGFLLVGALNRTGRFGAAETWLVYLVLFGYSLGLLASTSSRLLQNTFYALGETRTPARIAAFRVGLSAAVGIPLMIALDRIPVAALAGDAAARSGLRLGAVGLALASGVGSWFELLRLRAALTRRIPELRLPLRETGRLLLLAAVAALPSVLLWSVLPPLHPLLLAPLVLLPYALVYFGLAHFLAPEELAFWVGRFGRRLRRAP